MCSNAQAEIFIIETWRSGRSIKISRTFVEGCKAVVLLSASTRTPYAQEVKLVEFEIALSMLGSRYGVRVVI